MTRAEAFRVLGVDSGASLSTIRSAYRKLSHRHHPDKGGRLEDMARINRAWEVVQDSSRLRAAPAPEAPPVHLDIGTLLDLVAIGGRPQPGRAVLTVLDSGEVALDVSGPDGLDLPSGVVVIVLSLQGELFSLRGVARGSAQGADKRCTWIRFGGLSSG